MTSLLPSKCTGPESHSRCAAASAAESCPDLDGIFPRCWDLWAEPLAQDRVSLRWVETRRLRVADSSAAGAGRVFPEQHLPTLCGRFCTLRRLRRLGNLARASGVRH